MKASKNKTQKATAPAEIAEDEPVVVVSAKDSETPEAPEAATEEEVEEEEDEAPTPVSIRQHDKHAEIVRFNVTVPLDPAPRIGHFSFQMEMNLTRLERGIIEIPRHVAEVLADAGKGMIIK